MIRPTRREFLKRAAGAGSAMALLPLGGACAQEPSETVTALERPSLEPSGPLAMSIARWKGVAVVDDELKALATRLTEEAVSALGGMGRFVGRGDVVWIKPNIAFNRGPELAATTNPEVVATLVRLCLDAGAKKVKVGDRTVHKAALTYSKSGIESAARAVGAEVVYIDERRFRDVAVNGERLREWPLYPEIIESDLVINVPIVKDHGVSRATMCMKNFMGVAGGRRGTWHQDIETCLCDITAYMKPRLCVLDAVRIMTDHGPTGGRLADVKRMDTVAAGTDIVALDAFAANLLGHAPARVASVKAGFERGLGEIDYTKLLHREIAVS